MGSVSRTLPIPGLVEHAIGLKTLPEAFVLRNRVTRMLELAEGLADDEAAAAALTFVVVGAGYAGVEGIAEMQDFAASVLDLYPRCRARGTRWVLVEARDRLMPEISDRLAELRPGRAPRPRDRGPARHDRRRRSPTDCVTLSPGEQLPARTLGLDGRRHPAAGHLRTRARARLRSAGSSSTSTCSVSGHDNMWAIGDAAAVPDPKHHGERPCPPTAQHAMRQGRVAAHNVAATVGRGAAAAVHLQDARRLRRHGPQAGRG